MMLSLFLAKLIGIYLLIASLELIFRKKELEAAIKDFASSKGLLAFSGSLSLLFGLAIVISHPIFSMDWRAIVTLIGCLLIIRGVIRITFPSHTQKTISKFFHSWYWLILIIAIILGIFLTFSGFMEPNGS